MFSWKTPEERAKYGPHKWIECHLGHSNTMCEYCCATPREIEVIGDMNHCEKNPPAEKVNG